MEAVFFKMAARISVYNWSIAAARTLCPGQPSLLRLDLANSLVDVLRRESGRFGRLPSPGEQILEVRHLALDACYSSEPLTRGQA